MFAFKPHRSAISQVAFSPDGASVATCGKAPAVRVSHAATGALLWEHTSPQQNWTVGLAYSPDGTQLAAVGWEAFLVFDASSGSVLHTYPASGYGIAFTPDGSSVLAFAPRPQSGVLRTNIRTGRSERIESLDIAMVNRLQFSPDGRFLAALARRDVLLINTRTEKCVVSLDRTFDPEGVGALAFHPTERTLVYSDGPKLIDYHFGAGKPSRSERKRSTKFIQNAAFTPNGKHLITVSNEATAVVWETAGWTEVREFAWDIGPLKTVAVAPDGTRAACASDRGRAVVWDLDV